MAAPLSTSRNNYTENPKNSSIYTPEGVCQFLFDLIDPYIRKKKILSKGYSISQPTSMNRVLVLDPAVGSGNLLKPFMNKIKYWTYGYDINHDFDLLIDKMALFLKMNFLASKIKYNNIDLVICNPPFNITEDIKKFLKKIKKGKSLLVELFIDKIFELYGRTVPLVVICPMGVRLNQRIYDKNRTIGNRKGARYRKIRDEWPPITSIISLPLDIFPQVEFHCEILIFNMPELESHYCLPEKYFY